MENELNETIDILKQNYEKFQNDHGKLVSVYFLDLQSLS
jgi:aromatic ring-opening dioxygenase LigB subunit